MQETLLTDRLSLDLITTSDAAFIFELVNSKGWVEFIGDRNIRSVRDATMYIDKILKNSNFNYWVIKIKNDSTPIGVVSFLKRDYLPYYDIGFALLSGFQGLGYALEATGKVLHHVAQDPLHARILATTLPRNERSIKLLMRLGLQFDREINQANETLHIYGAGRMALIAHSLQPSGD